MDKKQQTAVISHTKIVEDCIMKFVSEETFDAILKAINEGVK